MKFSHQIGKTIEVDGDMPKVAIPLIYRYQVLMDKMKMDEKLYSMQLPEILLLYKSLRESKDYVQSDMVRDFVADVYDRNIIVHKFGEVYSLSK